MADDKVRKFESSAATGVKLVAAGQPQATLKTKSGHSPVRLPGLDTPEGRTLILLRLIDRLKVL